jgi:predicted kinase
MTNPSLSHIAPATLHLVCGKIGAGKSTLCAKLAEQPATVLISEDSWLATLYPGEVTALTDYVRCSSRLKTAMAKHVQALLKAGVSVVLDFPSNTLAGRQWARGLFEAAAADHRLHFLDVPDEVCKARLHARNALGVHPFETTDAQFDQISAYFVAPQAHEGFQVVRYHVTP